MHFFPNERQFLFKVRRSSSFTFCRLRSECFCLLIFVTFYVHGQIKNQAFCIYSLLSEKKVNIKLCENALLYDEQNTTKKRKTTRTPKESLFTQTNSIRIHHLQILSYSECYVWKKNNGGGKNTRKKRIHECDAYVSWPSVMTSCFP